MTNVYLIHLDVDKHRNLEVRDSSGHDCDNLSAQFESAKSISPTTNLPTLAWSSLGTSREKPDIADVYELSTIAVSKRAKAPFLAAGSQACELLPGLLDDGETVNFVHVFPVDVFPKGSEIESYESGIGTFVTEIDEEAIADRPIFRSVIHRDDGGSVPGVHIHCTDKFKIAYEAAGLTGLLFEPFWPLKDRMEFLMERVRQAAAAEERGKLLAGNDSGDSPMPKGRVLKPKITWKKKEHPTPEQFAQYLWQAVIDQRMSGEWLGDAVSVNTDDALGITQLAAQAVTHLLDSGVDRNVLCHLARSICFESLHRLFATLDETGIQWPDDEPDWESLQIALVQEATLDQQGRLGGWPRAKR